MERFFENPLITPDNISPLSPELKVISVFNAGAVLYKDKILLLLRISEAPAEPIKENYYCYPVFNPSLGKVALCYYAKNSSDLIDYNQYRIRTKKGNLLNYISYLRVASGQDGVHFKIDPILLIPTEDFERQGMEDPRITKIGDTYYITYVAVSDWGIATALMSTKNFENFCRYGIIFYPENKNVVLFPKKINGLYVTLHRPMTTSKPEIWLAYSKDLIHWGRYERLVGLSNENASRIGAGAPPIETDMGWLIIYHGADTNNRYYLKVALLDQKDPKKILAVSKKPILEPEEVYEKEGWVPNIVFTCGALLIKNNVWIYYGGADRVICGVKFSLDEIFQSF